jgi:hypothetical protein
MSNSSKPSESENLTDFLYKSNSKMLRAALELHLPESIRIWFSRPSAEYQQQSAGEKTKKRIYFRAIIHYL